MGIYYLDASAIVKRYLRERGSQWMIALWESGDLHSYSSAALVDVEVVSALSRAHREGHIGLRGRNQAAALYVTEAEQILERIPLSTGVVQDAQRLALKYPLRAYDAVHLATVQELAVSLIRTGLPSPIFVSADDNLLSAAQAEGFLTDNPNDYA